VSVAAFIYASPAEWLGQLPGKDLTSRQELVLTPCVLRTPSLLTMELNLSKWAGLVKVWWCCSVNYLQINKGRLLVSSLLK